MNNEQAVRRLLNRFFFILYFILLVYGVLIKGRFFYEVVSPLDAYAGHTPRPARMNYNLVPFHTIKIFLSGDMSTSEDVKFFNVFGNIGLFMPYGFLFPLVFKAGRKFSNLFMATLLLTVFFEVFQLITNTGHCDIDDVILNTLGGVIGYLFFIFIYG